MTSLSTKSDLEQLTKEETIKLRKQYIGGSVTLFFKNDPLKIVRAEGQYMYDELDNQYLDCINNVAHVGHCHPHVVKAGAEQMALLSTNSRYLHDNIVLYAKRLTSYFPSKLSVCYFVNSGSEANDLAIRLARAHTHKKDVICLDGAYHGHLTTTIDISPYKFKKIGNGKSKKWVHVAPLPCSYRGKYTREEYNEDQLGQLYARDVQSLINGAHDNDRGVAAFISESMVSCGGQVILPTNYLATVYKYVRKAGGVCIADEVQVGFGRVGTHMWAFETQGPDAVPDIVTIGKPIGNGHPLACVVTTPEIAKSFEKIGTEYFNTYGGNPVSLAVANAVLDVLENEKLQEHALELGNYFAGCLEKMKAKYTFVGDVRAAGLFFGIDMITHPVTKEPATQMADFVIRRCKEQFVIISTEGKYGNVIKFKPPMVFTMDDAKRLVKTLNSIFDEIDDNKRSRSTSAASCGSNISDGESGEEGYGTSA
ncbi:Ethanolamine-phosphate phospho-lyase [Halotydeus destructor]|nr:Ethanolamine-phosphate phospho-lyase [Halotydeus destructor]